MSETKQQHWMRRGRELRGIRKSELCAMYRQLGGLGGIHPPEKWTKDEVITCIVEMEWDRLPEDKKLPDPPRLTPPCDRCGGGQDATAHQHGGDHNYRYTASDKPWVPASEAEAERLQRLGLLKPPAQDGEPSELSQIVDRVTGRDAANPDFKPCEKPECGQSPAAHVGWALGHLYTEPGTTARAIATGNRIWPLKTEEQPTEADATVEACRKCRRPFDPTDTRFVDSRARHRDTPFCGECTDRCHDTEIADHWCMIDQWRHDGSIPADGPGCTPVRAYVSVQCLGDSCTGCSDPQCWTVRADGGDV